MVVYAWRSQDRWITELRLTWTAQCPVIFFFFYKITILFLFLFLQEGRVLIKNPQENPTSWWGRGKRLESSQFQSLAPRWVCLPTASKPQRAQMCVELLAQALPAQHETAVWLLITNLHRKTKMAAAKHLHAVNCAKQTLQFSLELWKLLRKEYLISKEDVGWKEEGDDRRRQSPVGTQPRVSLPEWLTAVSLLTLALQTCWASLKLDQVVCKNVLKARGPPATVMTAQPMFSFCPDHHPQRTDTIKTRGNDTGQNPSIPEVKAGGKKVQKKFCYIVSSGSKLV